MPLGDKKRNWLIGWISHALLVQPSISVLANYFFLMNYELQTPSVEMVCLLGIQNEMQAV